MSTSPFTVLDAGSAREVPASIAGADVVLSPRAVETALGWEVKPQGLCRGPVCIPLPRGSASEDGGLALSELARRLERPLALDLAERAAYLGASARDRAATLASLQAPDFSLPDLQGRSHSLSEQRGKKVLLVAYASW